MTFFHSRNKFIKKTYDYSGGTNLAMKLIWPTVVNLYFCIKDISHILYTLLLISYIVGFFLYENTDVNRTAIYMFMQK